MALISLALLLVLSMAVFTANTADVPKEMKAFIGILLKQYIRYVNSGEIIQPNIVHPVTENEIFRERPSSMLPVLLWDPLVQFLDIFSRFICPYCTLERKGRTLKTTSIWNDGTSKKRNPRMIFDINHPVLVARRYRCSVESDHCFVSTHTSILEHLEKHKLIAFKLTINSGYFNTLSEAVCVMTDRGMSFNRIAKIIKSIYHGTGIMPFYRKDVILRMGCSKR